MMGVRLPISLIEELDEVYESDDRYWNRTHLVETALRKYIKDWHRDEEGTVKQPDTGEELEADRID